MFDIELSEPRQVVLVRFRGQLSEADFNALDQVASQHRGGDQFDCIFDMTNVEKIDLATEFVAKRGELPQAFTDRERIYAVPQDDLKLLVRLYAAYQASKGWRPPTVVDTMEAAFQGLGVSGSAFRPAALAEGGSPA